MQKAFFRRHLSSSFQFCKMNLQLRQSHSFKKEYNSIRFVAQDKFGDADELYIKKESKVFIGDHHDVLIKIHSTALNRADLLIRQGKYPGQKKPKALGLEMAGVVESVGCDVKRFMPGDEVMALLSSGGYADYTLVKEDQLMKVPNGISLLHAGGIPEVWLTAFQLIHFVSKLNKGEKILIHAGGSGVSTAAIQLAKLHGAEILVTAGNDVKLQKAISLGASLGVNYKTSDFKTEVLDFTNGRGVDVILDCVGSSYWKQNISCIAPDGRWVLYGLLGGINVDGPLLAQILSKRVSLIGTTLMPRSNKYKANLISSFVKQALPFFEGPDPKLIPIIDSVFPMKSVVEAHKYMATNQNNGKILLDVDHDRNA